MYQGNLEEKYDTVKRKYYPFKEILKTERTQQNVSW